MQLQFFNVGNCFLQVYWPMDLKAYIGYVRSYDKETKIHHVWPLMI